MTAKQKLLCLVERLVPRASGPGGRKPRAFLLWSITHLGDLVLQLPAAGALKRAHPESRVVMVAKEAFRSLVDMNPHVDDIIPYEARWSTRRDQRRSGPGETFTLRRKLASIDTAFIFDFHPLSRLLLRSAGIPELVGYGPRSTCLSRALSGPLPDQHRLDEGLALLAAAGIPASAPSYDLQAPPSARWSAEELLRRHGWGGEPLLAVCPGSGNPQKCWPPERFAAAAGALSRKNACRVMLLGSAFDLRQADAVANSLATPPVDLTGRTSVRDLAGVLSICQMVLTNDSGAMHLSAALGRPLVALFGPTNPVKWGPRGPGPQLVLRAESGAMRDLTVDQVLEAVRAQFGEVA